MFRQVLMTGVMVGGLMAGGWAWAGDGKTDQTLAGPKVEGKAGREGKGMGMGERRGPGEVREILATLNLTEDQKAKAKAAGEAFKAKVDAWREEHKTQIEQLKTQMQAARDAKDTAKMKELGPQMRDLMQSAPKPKELMDQIRAVLTEEQQKQFDAKLAEKMDEMKAKAHERMKGEGGERKHQKGEGKAKDAT